MATEKAKGQAEAKLQGKANQAKEKAISKFAAQDKAKDNAPVNKNAAKVRYTTTPSFAPLHHLPRLPTTPVSSSLFEHPCFAFLTHEHDFSSHSIMPSRTKRTVTAAPPRPNRL